MARTVEYAEKRDPRAYGIPVLMRHDARELVQVGQVVGGPSGEELGKRNGAKRWVTTVALQVGGLEI